MLSISSWIYGDLFLFYGGFSPLNNSLYPLNYIYSDFIVVYFFIDIIMALFSFIFEMVRFIWKISKMWSFKSGAF